MKPVSDMDILEFSIAYGEEIAQFAASHNAEGDPYAKTASLIAAAAYMAMPELTLRELQGDTSLRDIILRVATISIFSGILCERHGWTLPED